MSKGPGRIGRRVEEAFLRYNGWLSLAVLTQDVYREYYRDGEHRIYDVQHKHAVSVRRAADKVAERLGWVRIQPGRMGQPGRGSRTYYVPRDFLVNFPDENDSIGTS
jgi:hypothetical protein